MKVFKYPPRENWTDTMSRPRADTGQIYRDSRSVLDSVKRDGDRALHTFTRQFDGIELDELQVSRTEMDRAVNAVSPELKLAIDTARGNIEKFHSIPESREEVVTTMPGVACWTKTVPVERVGLYIPGGTAPLFSTVLMLGIPARLAGCGEIILCTPPGKDGSIHPAILYCARLLEITQVYRVGGAQAVAAMAYGTETIPAVDKIFGPGNRYVTAAKQLVSLDNVAIDMPAGPSELAVMADKTAEPSFLAADLLSQAEHGSDSQVILLTTDEDLIGKVRKELDLQLSGLPRREAAEGALENSRCILLKDTSAMVDWVNQYAPEHLIIMCENYGELADRIKHAGSVFLGPFSPESAGDYASGTNHTLPTGGAARAYSGLRTGSFMKTISFQSISAEGLQNLAPAIIQMAEEEQLHAHSQAVRIRVHKIQNNS